MTVAVTEIKPEVKFMLDDRDIEIFTTRGTGPGGQHKNVTESVVEMKHRPTGISSKASTRSQHDNRRTARLILEARVKAHYDEIKNREASHARKSQVGSGMRGDKIRTYREQDDVVIDHRTETKVRLKDVRAGKLNFN